MNKPPDPFAPLTEAEMSVGAHEAPPANAEQKVICKCPPAEAEHGVKAAARLFGRKPDHLWRYATSDGSTAYYACRWDFADGTKTFRPLSYVDGDGWAFVAWCDHRPLYLLDEIAAKQGAPIIVCEGEKSAEAAATIFPQFIATTSSGGANAAAKSDWTPLAGRQVLIWPDNDEAGRKYAQEVGCILMALGCVVSIIDANALAAINPQGGVREPAPKWDAADAANEWSDSGALRKAALDLAPAFTQATEAPKFTAGRNQAVPDEDSWSDPKPIDTSLPPVQQFDADLLPPVLRAYICDVADRQQSPPDFVAVTTLCALSAMCGNRVRMKPKQFDDWSVVPNLWGALIGPPSAMKSPALKAALPPVYALEESLRKEWEAAQLKEAVNSALEEMDGKAVHRKAEKAMKSGDREEARRLLADSLKEAREPPKPLPRLTINDATVEKLGELLNENPRGLLLIRDELAGFLARMEREEFQGERAFYLEAFNGDGQFTYDRIGRGTVHISNCTLSIIGGVQPSRIAPLVRGAMTGSSDDGLIQRLQLAVWPDPSTKWVWTDRLPNAGARREYEKVFRRIHEATKDLDEPIIFSFSSEGQELFIRWMQEIQTDARAGKLPPSLESHLLKMPKTVCSLALIFHLVEGDQGPVSAEATARALDWADYLRSHAMRLYSSGSMQIEQGARLIIERRAQLSERFTTREVQRKQWAGIADRDAVADVLDLLVSSGYCREIRMPAAAHGGRPTSAYQWNPRLKGGG